MRSATASCFNIGLGVGQRSHRRQQGCRSLKQIDPYGYTYYDPYVAGVTPGFVNLDLNRETGLHLGVGDAVIDVSADKNYVGFGLGQALGFGKAKDRGWNLQLGGGNVLDVSLTRDAGLGLWALDGLLNVNIGPDNKDNSRAGVAAMSTPGDPAPAPEVTSVVVDESSIRSAAMDAAGQPPTQVFVDATTTESYPTYGTGSAEAYPTYGTGSAEAYPTYGTGGPAGYASTVEQNPPLDPYPTYTTGGAAQTTEQNPPYPTYGSGSMPVQDDASISVTEDYPTYTTGAVAPGAAAAAVAPAAGAAAAAAAPRRACEGGEQVWVAGNKYKCRYKRAQQLAPVQVAAGLNTYANGVRAR
ncbi:hypothetical protein OEZ85_011786 [Tetradesmus obliquus]|uniref:Peptidase A1 domain-containing protein n=1 Tax=Tetradesmus obliquus TaxID=3088 RepID=A0ABY8TS54_TETOB|nr:hypothetical protein OEZ85_011786 [Tetradesmus obliquus]